MRLLYTITAYPPSVGGAQLLTHYLAQQWLGRHPIQVITQWDTNRTDWLLGSTLNAPVTPFGYIQEGVAVQRITLAASARRRLTLWVYAYKGLAAILSAAPLVWRRRPEARFVFVGPRTNYSLSLFKHLTDRRILELEAVSLQDKTDALGACTVLCVPSSQESFGGVYTEAW